MSRIRMLGASAVALMIGVGGATAADIYAPAPVAEVIYSPAPAFSWTGGYMGGLLGYEWGKADVRKRWSVAQSGRLDGRPLRWLQLPDQRHVRGRR